MEFLGGFVAGCAFLGTWWCVFAVNARECARVESFPFEDRDSMAMWREIQAAMNRPTEGDK